MFIVGRTPGSLSDIFAVGPGTYLNEVIELAGGENVFADSPVPYPTVNMEEIIHRNPDLIIDMGHDKLDTEAQRHAVRQLWKKMAVLRAVQANAVFPTSAGHFVVPGPRVVDAVRDIRRMTGN